MFWLGVICWFSLKKVSFFQEVDNRRVPGSHAWINNTLILRFVDVGDMILVRCKCCTLKTKQFSVRGK